MSTPPSLSSSSAPGYNPSQNSPTWILPFGYSSSHSAPVRFPFMEYISSGKGSFHVGPLQFLVGVHSGDAYTVLLPADHIHLLWHGVIHRLQHRYLLRGMVFSTNCREIFAWGTSSLSFFIDLGVCRVPSMKYQKSITYKVILDAVFLLNTSNTYYSLSNNLPGLGMDRTSSNDHTIQLSHIYVKNKIINKINKISNKYNPYFPDILIMSSSVAYVEIYCLYITPNFINLRTTDFQSIFLFQQKLVFTCIFLSMFLFGLFCHFDW